MPSGLNQRTRTDDIGFILAITFATGAVATGMTANVPSKLIVATVTGGDQQAESNWESRLGRDEEGKGRRSAGFLCCVKPRISLVESMELAAHVDT